MLPSSSYLQYLISTTGTLPADFLGAIMNLSRALQILRRPLQATLQSVSRSKYEKLGFQTTIRHVRTTQGGTVDEVSSHSAQTLQNDQKPIFPDPSDPFTNPLASLSSDILEERAQRGGGTGEVPAPGVYERKVNENGVAFAKGGRKRSFARVWIREGTGIVNVNGRSWVDYFPCLAQRDKIIRPMVIVGMVGRFDMVCSVNGGGHTGQAEAIRFSLARALQNWEPAWRPTLKKEGLLRRDARIVEPKKYGRKKARKSFQWVKR